MIVYILLILVGAKLNMLNGWYLGLIIAGLILKVFSLAIDCYKM